MKSFKVISLLATLLPLSGCAGRPDYTLNPPASTEWVTVAVKLPAQIEVGPMDVLYRSEKCQREDYDSTTESHIRQERGYNPRVVRMEPGQESGLWQKRIAFDGGGECEWKLSAIRVDIQPAKGLSLVLGKEIIPTSYVFGFDDEAYGGGEGSGRKKEARGNLNLRTELFPTIVINHMFNEITFELFGGDTGSEKWSRHFRLIGTKKILLEPTLNIHKVVRLESPKGRKDPPGMTITYPDGEVVHERRIEPDYEKLLSIK